APDEKIHDGPEEDPHQARGARPVEIEVAQEERPDTPPHQSLSAARGSESSPSRAIAMKTSSSDPRCARAMTSAGVPSATARPRDRKRTRLHIFSTSFMLCEV